MEKHEATVSMGLLQMAEWAAEFVEGQTCIPEAPFSALEPKEVAALALMGALIAAKGG